MRRKKRIPKKRNPIAKMVKKIRPQAVPDRRRKKLADARKREAIKEMDGSE